jgi:ATP-dependent RNA helicase RhlE
VRVYGKYLPIKSMVMFGGVGMGPQLSGLRNGIDILVATPGRLLDHHQQGNLDLSKVEFFVLDEADRMLDMGFVHDIKRVLAILPAKKQSLLFSATFSDEIKALADRLLNAPQVIEVARRNATAETIAQKVHPVGREQKKDLLAHLIKSQQLASGAGVHAHEARCQPPGRVPGKAGHLGHGHPRQQEPERPHQGLERVQDR